MTHLGGVGRILSRRLAAAVPLAFGVALVSFFLVNALPGNTAQQLLGIEATPEQIAQLEKALDLDRPSWARYLDWLGGVVQGDLGRSLASGRPISDMLAERLPVTMQLALCVLAVSLMVAVPLSLLCALRRGRPVDRLSMLASATILSVPNYVLALGLIMTFAVVVPVLPSIGYVPFSSGLVEGIRSLTLPTLAIALPMIGYYTCFLRCDLVEQLDTEPYSLTAAAKGLAAWQVLTKHALRNSLFGLLTVVGLNFGALVGGTVIIEQIFALPGLGQLLLQSIGIRDAPVIQAIVLLLAMVTIAANLAADLLYAALDPRIRDARRAQ